MIILIDTYPQALSPWMPPCQTSQRGKPLVAVFSEVR